MTAARGAAARTTDSHTGRDVHPPSTTAVHAFDRWLAWYVATGAGFIVLGGAVSAVSGPLGWRDGSWLAAYLVLVWGASQCLFGYLRIVAPAPMRARGFTLEYVGWNLGNAAVIGGDLVGAPALVAVGGVLLAAVLVVQLVHLRHTLADRRGWAIAGGVVLAVLLVSIPVGVVLSAVTGVVHGHP